MLFYRAVVLYQLIDIAASAAIIILLLRAWTILAWINTVKDFMRIIPL